MKFLRELILKELPKLDKTKTTIIIMVEVDDQGFPSNPTFMSFGKPLETLGLIEAIEIKLADLKEKIWDKIHNKTRFFDSTKPQLATPSEKLTTEEFMKEDFDTLTTYENFLNLVKKVF